MSEPNGQARSGRGLGPVLLTVLLDLLGFGLVIPLISFYAEDYGATERQAIALLGVYSLAQFVFAPMWGALSDRFGRRSIMLLSIGATAASLAAFALSQTLWLLFLFRLLHGAFAANISTAQAYVADVTTPENRARGMGLIGAAFGIGFTIGPWVGGELSVFGITAPIWLAAALSTVNFVWAWFGLPESRPERGRAVHPRRLGRFALWSGLSHPVVGLAILLTFAATLAFAMMEFTFPLVAEHRWAMNERDVGRMFGLIGGIGIVVQGMLIHALVRRLGEARLVGTGYLLNAAGLTLLAMAAPGGGLYAACAVLALGASLANPSLQSLISRGAGEDEQGVILGVNQSLSALARAVAPWAALALYDPSRRVAPFLGGALIMVVALVIAIPATRRARIRSAPRAPESDASSPARRASATAAGPDPSASP